MFIPVLPICPLDVLLFCFNPLCWYWQMCPIASLDAPVLILMLFCLSILIWMIKSIVEHSKAVLIGVFIIKTSVFIIIAFDRTHCHQMLISSSIVNVSWLYSLIPAYTNFPFNYLPLISYRLLFTAYKMITILYLHICYLLHTYHSAVIFITIVLTIVISNIIYIKFYYLQHLSTCSLSSLICIFAII